MTFQRYRPFIRDWAAFARALERPEPRTFRIRSGRLPSGTLSERLEAQGFRLSPSPHVPDVMRVDLEPFPLSETLEHWLGLLYIQQEATALAAPLLEPRPGEGILDLCAAPGGKTTHLADLMGDRGLVVAMDSSEPRIRALSGNLSRLVLSSVVAVKGRGERTPRSAAFHRVLVDAPCSGEGRARRGGAKEASPGDLKRLPRLQEALLRRGVEVTAPGGRILYVTCTLAPEENEAVVDRVLRDVGARLIPLTPDLPHAPGLTRFLGNRFLPELEGACRIHPHHLDSGGLFMALLEREGGEAGSLPPEAPGLLGWSPLPKPPPTELTELVAATPSLQGRGWLARGDAVRMVGAAAWPLESWMTEDPGWDAAHAGLRALVREKGKRGKGGRKQASHPPAGKEGEPLPPGRAAMDLLRWLNAPGISGTLPPGTLPSVDLSREKWMDLLAGRELRPATAPDGVVALTLEGQVVGRGRVRRGRLLGELSPPRAAWLRRVLARESGDDGGAEEGRPGEAPAP